MVCPITVHKATVNSFLHSNLAVLTACGIANLRNVYWSFAVLKNYVYIRHRDTDHLQNRG